MYGAHVCDHVTIGAGARVAGFVCDGTTSSRARRISAAPIGLSPPGTVSTQVQEIEIAVVREAFQPFQQMIQEGRS